MAYYKRLVIVALFAFSQVAHAGFSSMRPPPGYSKTSSGSTQQPGWGPTYKPAAGEFYDLDKKRWMTTASLNTGGRELTVPVSMPLATGANVALAVATAFSSNPAILLGTAAWALYQAYLAQKDITATQDGTFLQTTDNTDTRFEWQNRDTGGWYPSMKAAFEATVPKPPYPAFAAVQYFVSAIDANTASTGYRSYGADGSTVTGSNPGPDMYFPRREKEEQSTSTKVITPQQVANELANLPMTKPLVDALPMPLPVNPPVINPDSAGKPKVLRVPQGSASPMPLPSPNPDNLPQSWKTPVVDVIPSPTPDDPWRVETIPKDIIKTDPSPLPDPYNPTTPDPTPVTPPDTDPGTSEQAKQPGLCDEYPDILACAKPVLDTPPADEFKNKTVTLAIVKDEGWGPASAACPAPKTANIMGVSLSMPFTLICEVAQMINPLLIGFAWLSAAFTFIGIGRRD